MVCKLYPFHSIALKTVFVYGRDSKRETNFLVVSERVVLIVGLILLFIILAAIVLRIIRKKFNLSGTNLLITFTDCLIPFIGGGSLQMRNRWERLFFVILSFGAFFIVSMFGGDILNSFIILLSGKVENFNMLAKTNSSIYIDQSLHMYSNNITALLRYSIHLIEKFKLF